MNLSRKWLNEFVTVDANDKDFAEAMTLSGSKVEVTEDLGAEISNVVVGRILSMERHPDSDHMWVCQLEVGKDGPIQIVTGAWNIHVGDLVPVALHKSTLPGGKKIEKGKLRGVVSNGMMCGLSELGLDEEAIKNVRRIYIIGCGSAYHVGVAARYVFESLARLPVEVDVASEFRYRDPVLEPDSMAVIISQSGETADTLAALRECKERGVRTIGIVNVVGSSIAREADATLYTWAGPEIAVATTKAYSTQLAACYLLAVEFARVRGKIEEEKYAELVAELQILPDKIAKTLTDNERIQWFASKYASAKDAFFIGRGLDYAVALEGSLKFKEISYIHSEAFAAGEMKHGPISLIEKNMLVVGVLTQPDLYEKMGSNLVEAKSRGAYIMGLTTYGNYSIEDTANFTVYVPKTDPHFATSLSVVPLQLLAYYVSCAKGLDVDKPRNLAKSVTVE